MGEGYLITTPSMTVRNSINDNAHIFQSILLIYMYMGHKLSTVGRMELPHYTCRNAAGPDWLLRPTGVPSLISYDPPDTGVFAPP